MINIMLCQDEKNSAWHNDQNILSERDLRCIWIWIKYIVNNFMEI